MPGRPVITAHLCKGLSPCMAHCVTCSYLVHTLKVANWQLQTVLHGAEVSYR